MNNPRNVSIDVGDPSVLWVTNTGSNQVWRVTTAGVVQAKFYGMGSSNPTYLKSPFGIANDATGVYVADTYKNRIVKIRKDNGNEIWTETACNGALSRPRDVTVGPDGNIYAVDTDHNQVVGMNPTTHACITRFGNSTQFKGHAASPATATTASGSPRHAGSASRTSTSRVAPWARRSAATAKASAS